ncbi:hypothetical protein HYC85_005585 [Camellia sinensis]|uniref:non-specific serine/threonine protein kinase n=1 Tax=Camellia sinensis TaxID=4442 RepID=A0A7J7HZX8_CAMSI|nr:hypothetical protein HYC85_005585 [Camellia sinensis]
MEGSDNWKLRPVNCFILCLFFSIQSACAQEGFVSIQCCADSNFTDPITRINWITDNDWYPDKLTCQNIIRPVQNDTGYDEARLFSSWFGDKWCYNLTTVKDRDYLIRGTFLLGDVQSSFYVLIGVTRIGIVNSSNDMEIEGRRRREILTFRKLELRPLNDSDYLKREPSSVLKLIDRVDVGSDVQEIRYPYDPYDRIWRKELNQNQTANRTSSSTAYITNGNTTAPPIQVLQTALTHPERLEFLHNDLDTGYYNFDLYLYFLELNNTVQAGQRVFDIFTNNEKREETDILAGGSNYQAVILNFTANGFLNLTLIKASHGSQFGPLINAYEILQVHPWVQETAQADVDMIQKVRNDKLQGPLPSSITELTHLKELNMSNNDFIDAIPAFPASSVLTSVDLSHNDLMGKIPESLTSLPYLKTLYFGCNPHFSEETPANLNSSKLKTDEGVCSSQESSHTAQRIVIGTVAGGSLSFVTVAVAIFLVCFHKQKLMAMGKWGSKGHPMAKETATQKYKTMIGEGGFGSVYRGTLTDGQEVAVKVRSATSTQGTREFNNELNLLSAIRHENLVPLLGYCCENDQQILVYPFMSNGSLQDRLYGEAAKRKTLDWPTRLSIALGLMYLHSFAGRCVIHRDVKSSNILLDHSMCAKVADFGFSKYAPQEGDSGASLEVRGTAGYLDPEYYSTQHLSAKSDVFSFGVVLLEIISGREPLNIHRPRNEWSLVEWAKPFITNSKIDGIVDPSIKGGYHAEALWRVVEVALACIEPFSAYRPCMVDIVRELEDALIIENNASEYMKSIDSFGGSNRFSIERMIVLPPTPTETETSSILSQPAPPQPR